MQISTNILDYMKVAFSVLVFFGGLYELIVNTKDESHEPNPGKCEIHPDVHGNS